MNGCSLRPARPEDAPVLSELAFRSKAYWGYDDTFMEACRAELTVHRNEIEAGRVVVATVGGALAGFSTLAGEPPVAELDALFVEPRHIGAGVGTTLFMALREAARTAGFTRLMIEADPNAVDFYERRGAVRTGDRPSASIPGRTLPLLKLDLTRPP